MNKLKKMSIVLILAMIFILSISSNVLAANSWVDYKDNEWFMGQDINDLANELCGKPISAAGEGSYLDWDNAACIDPSTPGQTPTTYKCAGLIDITGGTGKVYFANENGEIETIEMTVEKAGMVAYVTNYVNSNSIKPDNRVDLIQALMNEVYPEVKDQGSLGQILENYTNNGIINDWNGGYTAGTKKILEEAYEYGKQVATGEASEFMDGRMMIVGAASGKAQARIVVYGGPGEPPPPPPPSEDDNPPVIVVEKYDASTGGKLNGVILNAVIDDVYSKAGEGNNFTIYFGDLLKADGELVGELSNPYMNNAAKLLDPKYECGVSLSQGTLSSYVYGLLYGPLMARVTGSPTYQHWAQVVADCTEGCSNGHAHCKGGCYWCSGDEDHSGHWVNVQRHKHDKCPDYQAAMAAAVAAVGEFAEKYCEDTDTIRRWLYEYQFHPGESGITFGTSTDSIPYGEIDPIEFIHSAYEFYIANKGTPLKVSHLLKVYTGDLRVDMTELSTVPGYLLWKNENTKFLKIQYGYPSMAGDNGGGDVTNSMDIYTNSEGTYKVWTNDEVEMEHEGTKGEPSDGTYDVTRIKCYNEPDDTVVLEVNKYGELTSNKRNVEATFQIDLKATETYWDGSTRVKNARFTKSTQNGRIEFTSGEYWEKLGIDVISRWKGTIDVTVKELKTDGNYILWDHEKSFRITYKWEGNPPSITEISNEKEGPGENAIVETPKGVKVILDAYNTPKSAPQIIIQKNDLNGSGLRGAVFNAVITRLDNGASMNMSGLTTNDAGQIIIYAEDLDNFPKGNKIDVINRWTGTLRITLVETRAPNGYQLIEEPIVVDVNFREGKIVSMSCSNQDVTVRPYNTSYTDNGGYNGIAPTGTITIKDKISNRLRIRKVDGDTIHQDYLGNEARFNVILKLSPDGNFKGKSKMFTETVDGQGYIDLTKQINDMGVNLGQYSGEINVIMRELRGPNGYIDIEETIEVTLIYRNGYLIRVNYPNRDDLSKAIIDVGESEDRTSVTIAVKNTKYELQPIHISKVDSQTGKALYNVNFKVTIATSQITDNMKSVVYNTSDDGVITIPKEALKEIGVNDWYTGEVYVLLEEIGTASGYKHLDEKVYVRVDYDNGNVKSASIIKGSSVADYTITTVGGKRILKISVDNERLLPDLIISKESLSNGNAQVIESAVFNVRVSAAGRTISKRETVGKDGKIIFKGNELEALGIDGRYTGDITVDITEESVTGAVIIPEEVQAVISVENGVYKDSKVSNEAHVSVVSNIAGSVITVKVLNDIVKEDTIISGIVWEESATTKAEGTLIDGKYTTSSESEYSDKLFEGIEVTLYQKSGNSLTLVTSLTGGTNPTLTDSQGYYEFQVPMGSGNYVVEFTYNGQTYTAAPSQNYSTQSEDWKISSKGSEFNGASNILSTRNYVNTLLEEIGSYPANYKMRDVLFNSNDIPTVNNLRAAYASGYNVAYRYDELEDVYEKVKIEMRNYLSRVQIMRDEKAGLREAYTNVVNNYYRNGGALTDNEIYNKLQYIYDSRVSAYAGYYTREGGVNDLSPIETYNAESKELDAYQRFVNLGIYRRDKTDLTLKKDLYESTVSMNRYDETYNYNTGKTSYTQYVYEEDYNYNKNANSNGLAWYQDDQVELYLKYKITVENTTNTLTKLTEIADYFDSRFGYNDLYTTSSGATLKGVEAYKITPNGGKQELSGVSATAGGKYIPASLIGLTGTKDYAELFVTFADGQEPSLVDGEKVEIYVTIKLGKDGENGSYKVNNAHDRNKVWASEIIKTAINDPQNLEKTLTIHNYAEVNGYITVDANGNAMGYLDSDSKPGTFIVKDYEDARVEYLEAYKNKKKDPERFAKALDRIETIRQDDVWSVALDLKNNLTDNKNSYYHRTLNGNVWEAIDEKVKTSTDLYNDTLLTYIAKNGLKGIVVELIEVEPGGTQYVRARTVTGENGEYSFRGYIAGDYSVRFVYGEAARDGYTDEQNNIMKDTSVNGGNDHRGINGQYYQSTKANPDTDNVKYWYAKYVVGNNNEVTYEASSNPGVKGNNNTERYSDAYDEVTARINQISAKTAGNDRDAVQGAVDNSWSWDYEWDGVENVQTRKHLDTIEAYTSTMKAEIEYTKNNITGDQNNEYYRYSIDNVDFGVTPRAISDMNIDTYASNVKLYLQDGTLQLDVDLNADGSVKQYNNDAIYQNIVIPTPGGEDRVTDKDGLLEVLFDTSLLNGTTLEITYTVTVSNDGQSNTITYFYDTDSITKDSKPIALAYYNGHRESLETLVYYEQDREANGITKPIVKHETAEEKFETRNSVKPVEINVRTRATNIIDYIDPALNFTQVNKNGEAINRDWELTTLERFNSTREEEQHKDIMDKYNTIIRAVGGDTYENYLAYLAAVANGTEQSVIDKTNYSNLYKQLLPGESISTTLMLSKVLQTTSTETNDYVYSNLIELAKIENYAGKIIDIEGYDILGINKPETSEIGDGTKTLGTSKSETLVIHEPTGLSMSEEYKSNLGIVLISLVILAGGVFLIKKFVLTPKAE